MNTSLFKYAVEVERTGSISHAARNLMMAQPNLSKAIKELEESVGFAIFERTPRGVVPTPRGNVFLDYARSILSQIESIQALSAAAGKDLQQFGVTIPRGSWLSEAIVSFAAGLDGDMGLDLDIRETSSMEVINNVTSGRYNLGIIRYRSIYERYFSDFLAHHRLSSETIWEFELLVLLSREHELAHAEKLEPEMLASFTEIVHGDTAIPYLSAQTDTGRKHGAPAGRHIRLYERGNQFELLSRMPATFMWSSPIPRAMLDRYGLVQRRCSIPDNSYKDLLIYPAAHRFTVLEKQFIDQLDQTRDTVAGQTFA